MSGHRYAKKSQTSSTDASNASNWENSQYNRWYKKKPSEIIAYLEKNPRLLRKGPKGLSKENRVLWQVINDKGLLEKIGYLFDRYAPD